MEVDQNGPALFVPIEAPSLAFDFGTDKIEEEELSLFAPATIKFTDFQSINNYLTQIISDPSSKDSSFILSSNWTLLLETLKNNVELARGALKFAHEHLLQMNREVSSAVYSLLSTVVSHTVSLLQLE